MKTHKRTLIMMLIFCMLLAVMPVLITDVPVSFAVSEEDETTEDTGEVMPDEPADEDAAPAGEAELPEEENKAEAAPETETAEKADGEAEAAKEDRSGETPDSEAEEAPKEKPVLRMVSNGDKISYTASRHSTSNAIIFKATMNGQQYKGTCNECGIAYRSSGTMTVVPLGKNDLRRKVAYKYGSWLESEDRNYNMGGVYKGACLESMMQYARAWQDDKAAGGSANRTAVVNHWKKSSSNGGNGWSASTCSAITDAVKELNGKTADQLKIPNKFRAYFGEVKNAKNDEGRVFGQDPVFWGDLVTGTVSVKKAPAEDIAADVAAHPENYDLGGAVYQLWTDKACKTKAKDVNWANATLTTKSDGTSNTRTMEVGTYYLTETKAPSKGYGLDVDDNGKVKVHTVTIKKGTKSTPNLKEPGKTVPIPEISTTASLQNDNREVRDIIEYSDILPNTNYVFRGWLVDTVTGEKVPGSDGVVELSSRTNTSGQVEMILKTENYDDMNGYSLTAFEELYVMETAGGTEKETLVAEHKDTDDSDQTVEIHQDLRVMKNVTGNLGDLTKEFEYTLEFTGLVPGEAYEIEGDDEKTFMADADGIATVPLKLRDDQEATIKKLPKSATYMVTEAASDHVAGFRLFPEETENEGAKITVREGSNSEEASKELSTAEETVDLSDGTIVVLWENNRDLATLTGVSVPDYSVYAAVLVLLVLASVLIIRKRSI